MSLNAVELSHGRLNSLTSTATRWNTSTEVKARADWVVTSSNAIKVVEHLMDEGEKILWAPDRHLGHYIQSITGADMLMWQGACVVHESFRATGLEKLKRQYPAAAVLVHPESPAAVIEMADVVGSTTRLLKAVKELPNETFIVATDNGIFYKMSQAVGTTQACCSTTSRWRTNEFSALGWQ